MKFMLLLYDNPDARHLLTPELMEDMGALMTELTASGELVATDAFAGTATTVKPQVGGAPVITDGPYAEAKEVMGGFLILECDAARANQIAADWPAAALTAAIEVRPLMVHDG
ncbi:hypothetical protein DSM112329_04186 [Paraconexibacter sp. AEG42_29]|uniref:YCII-related domain-containing protein n=1 Tax=Paraconexibacter sp. AEG42_29 TaxID=2997339 RepID=A0AAU7B088_9ACTN